MEKPPKHGNKHEEFFSNSHRKRQTTSNQEQQSVGKEIEYDQFGLAAWKESVQYAKHWESLVFESAKNYFTVIAFALAGAGVAVAWSSVDRDIQQYVIIIFLVLAFVLSVAALLTIKSQQDYLLGFYKRRREIEEAYPSLVLRHDVKGGGSTIFLLRAGFFSASLVALALALLVFLEDPPLLAGAKLQGADLRVVKGITQHDLKGACGDLNTKLPAGFKIDICD